MSIIKRIMRKVLWLTLSFLPKNPRKAVCQSYYGRGYSDSPKAIAEELRRRGWQVFWTVKGH